MENCNIEEQGIAEDIMSDKAENNKNSTIHPGIYIKENVLNQKNMTQKTLAEILGVSRQTINLLVQGKAHLTPAMALRLSKLVITWRPQP